MEELGKILRRTSIQGSSSANTGVPPENEPSESEKCPTCRGHGWFVLDVPVNHPDFGKSFTCECALQDMATGLTDRLKRYSNLGPLTRLNFDNLNPKGLDNDPARQSEYEDCYEQARKYATDPRGWLVITGPSGCGKTHLAAAIANECIRRGMPVFWTIVPDFLDHLRATFGPNSDTTYDELFERVKNAPLLILDDLGTHSSTPWAEEKLFQVLNHRFNAQLPTVVTTIDLAHLDERLQTRLQSPGLSTCLNLRKRSRPLFGCIGGITEEVIQTKSFKNFDIHGMNADKEQRSSLRTALKAARDFAESPEDWLVLYGPTGAGKTHLAAAIANHQISNRRPVLFASVPELIDSLRPSFGPEARLRIDIEVIKSSPLLILDDLELETASASVRGKIYQILDYRYVTRLATVVTMLPSSLEDIDYRLRSRLMDPQKSNPIPVGAPDYRGGQDKARPAPKRKTR